MVNIELLKKICLTPGAPGFEQPIRSLLMNELKSCVDDIQTDAMGNLIAFKKGMHSTKLMLTAHMDEIAFIVQHIDDDGFIRFLPLGGFDAKTLTAQRVIIHGKKEIISLRKIQPLYHSLSARTRNLTILYFELLTCPLGRLCEYSKQSRAMDCRVGVPTRNDKI